jgi:hypothetical protein
MRVFSFLIFLLHLWDVYSAAPSVAPSRFPTQSPTTTPEDNPLLDPIAKHQLVLVQSAGYEIIPLTFFDRSTHLVTLNYLISDYSNISITLILA